MRSTIASLVAYATTALAHYNFEALIVNDEVTTPYEYVRAPTNSNSPVTDVTSSDFVCNTGGLDADVMAKTSTYTVQAGDSVGFTMNPGIGHPGPLHVYMSKATSGTAQDYDGSGGWFKAYSLTTNSITDEGLQWATYTDSGITNFTFAIPDDLEAGEYLMRAEHIALHGSRDKGGAQFYIGCAQLKVEGSGSAAPADTVSIPGVYDGSEPGIFFNIYYPIPTNYTDPGPATWPNGCEDSTVNYGGQTSDGDCNGSSSTSSSSGGNSTTGSGATPTSTSKGSSSTPVSSAASEPVSSGSGYDSSSYNSSNSTTESSSSEYDDSCNSKRTTRSANKKRAAHAKKNGFGRTL